MVAPRLIYTIRLAAFGTALLLSLICLGLAAHLASIFTSSSVPAPDWLGMAIAVPVLTMVAVGVSLGVDAFRKGAFTAMVCIELVWTSIIWVLWIANAGLNTSAFSLGCRFVREVGFFDFRNGPVCGENQALIAFSWLNWFIFLGWNIFLWVSTIISHTRGNSGVWTQAVTEVDFYAYSNTHTQPTVGNNEHFQQQPAMYGTPTMQQQQTSYPPMQNNYQPTTMQTQPMQNNYQPTTMQTPPPANYPHGMAQV